MNLYGLTDIGSVRKDNQDSYAIRVLSDDAAVAVVCDGMGGARAGNVASAVAVEAFAAAIEDGCTPEIPPDDGSRQALLLCACQKANTQVHELAKTSEEFYGMGTTLVAALILKDYIYVVNVGDSRCYLLHTDDICQVTQDHSLVQALVNRGEITPEQARRHPKKNLITRALGVDAYVDGDLFQMPSEGVCGVVLCSDGLSNIIRDEEILREINGSAPEKCCQNLLAMALSRGAPDNVTIVLAQM